MKDDQSPRIATHYESNGEAGDGQTVCDACGCETDEGHLPDECPDSEIRKPGCRCTWEPGDSPCPVHGEE